MALTRNCVLKTNSHLDKVENNNLENESLVGVNFSFFFFFCKDSPKKYLQTDVAVLKDFSNF